VEAQDGEDPRRAETRPTTAKKKPTKGSNETHDDGEETHKGRRRRIANQEQNHRSAKNKKQKKKKKKERNILQSTAKHTSNHAGAAKPTNWEGISHETRGSVSCLSFSSLTLALSLSKIFNLAQHHLRSRNAHPIFNLAQHPSSISHRIHLLLSVRPLGKIFLSFFFFFFFWPICDFVLDLLFAVAALCGFLLRRRGSRCCPLWVSSLPSWVSSLPFVRLRRLEPPLSWVSIEMREKEPEMRSRKSWGKKKNAI
jgi:hypothetical protein